MQGGGLPHILSGDNTHGVVYACVRCACARTIYIYNNPPWHSMNIHGMILYCFSHGLSRMSTDILLRNTRRMIQKFSVVIRNRPCENIILRIVRVHPRLSVWWYNPPWSPVIVRVKIWQNSPFSCVLSPEYPKITCKETNFHTFLCCFLAYGCISPYLCTRNRDASNACPAWYAPWRKRLVRRNSDSPVAVIFEMIP